MSYIGIDSAFRGYLQTGSQQRFLNRFGKVLKRVRDPVKLVAVSLECFFTFTVSSSFRKKITVNYSQRATGIFTDSKKVRGCPGSLKDYFLYLMYFSQYMSNSRVANRSR
ncbi:MAG: hypothetical protein KAR83_04065, partial [Thermodesulfovibrionales bacterium]|nr:hypothetical protein [Thermodesulfovibrionales bacterium]